MRKTSVLLALLVMFGIACGSVHRNRSMQRSDSAIEADVRSRIAEALPGKTYSVTVKVDDAVVILAGTAGSEEDRRKIGAAAQSVRDVASVINNIVVAAP